MFDELEFKKIKELKERVCEANLLLPKYNLVTFTWGNVSEIDRNIGENGGLVAIKPSGVEYDKLMPKDIVIVDLNGNVINVNSEKSLNPSSDTPTHLELYKICENIGGIVHTHSRWATIFAQMKHNIPALGTTHADYFYGDILCTRLLNKAEIANDYEVNTGKVIIETFEKNKIDYNAIPAVLAASHGPFCWGNDAKEAVHNAVVLEEIAFMAWHCGNNAGFIQQELLDKHYLRKHGKNAYYGQK